ncbi:MAG: M20 family metallopeptidase [Planctomycetota bacterium]|jgi:succinyl-diaminopimelate desuccinylase
MKELLKKLIRSAPTSENGELNAAKVLVDYFQQHGIQASLDQWDKTRANVVASVGSNDADAPTLLFGAHLDVVPASREHWQTDPFCPVERDGKIIGRGSVDMLGGLCAAAAAMVDLSKQPLNGRVIFAATAGEETDSCGVQRFVEQHRSQITNPVGVVITEPTGMRVLRAHRGILWLKVETFGKTAHGSTPQAGINRIAGGSATNIVPDSCVLELDIRTLPGQDHTGIIDDLQNLCDDLQKNDPDFKTHISIIRAVDGLETPADHPFIEQACRAIGATEVGTAGFTTDGPHFEKLSDAILILGPGDGSLCHKPDEAIEIEAVEHARQSYHRIACELLE